MAAQRLNVTAEACLPLQSGPAAIPTTTAHRPPGHVGKEEVMDPDIQQPQRISARQRGIPWWLVMILGGLFLFAL